MIRHPGTSRLCALSIDLDEIPNYHAIHGLPPPGPRAAGAVYELALERFASFAQSHDLPLTLFAVGADLASDSNARRLADLAARGHEIANHSLDHLYDLSRRPVEQVREQIAGGADAIERAVGRRPVGFRTPGYVVTDELLGQVRDAGMLYDSSVFPCPAYFGTKALAMALITARGRESRAIQDHPRVLLAPRRPYRIGRRFWQRGDGLVEIPIQVTPGARLPFIGTTLTMSGRNGARWLTRMVAGEPVVNLELHGIDLLDADDGLEALAEHQPDVREPVARKVDVLDAVVRTLREAGYEMTTLETVARGV